MGECMGHCFRALYPVFYLTIAIFNSCISDVTHELNLVDLDGLIGPWMFWYAGLYRMLLLFLWLKWCCFIFNFFFLLHQVEEMYSLDFFMSN